MKMISALILTLILSSTASAKMASLKLFKKEYPNSGNLNFCVLCHMSEDVGDDSALNSFGEAFKAAGKQFKPIESLDSDADGVSNINEITQQTFPGDATSKSNSIIEQLTDEEIEEVANYYFNN